MKTTTKVLGIINVLLTTFMLIFFFALLPEVLDNSSDGWVLLGYVTISLTALIVTLVLTVPLIVFLIKYKLPAIRFYFYSHVALFTTSIFLMIFAFLAR